MATEGIRNREWLDLATDCRYPLKREATAKDFSGVFSIPDDLLAALHVSVPVDLQLNPLSCYISRVIYTPSVLTLIVSGTVAGGVVELLRADISLISAAQQIASSGCAIGFFSGIGLFGDLRGRVTLGRLDNLKLQPVGNYTFSAQATGIEADCIRPQIRHVAAIEVETNPDQFVRLTGTIRLRAGQNARFRVESEDGLPVVYIDAVNAAELNEQLECEEGSNPAIKRINGLSGNSQREILIDSSRCMEITAAEAALAFRNACSEPCAGCAETHALEQIIAPISNQLPTLASFIARLQASIDQQGQAIAISQGPLQCNTAV